MILLTITVFIFILGLVIFVHELGHFVMAKRVGMKVEEFGFGFPPRLFAIRRKETIYSLNLIPLGGFVKILGEDDSEKSNNSRAFSNQPFWSRFSVLVAGVFMNFLLGWFLLFLGLSLVGTPMVIEAGQNLQNAKISNAHLTVIAVEQNSPAEYAGFRPGDMILTVDEKKFSDIEEMIFYTKSRAGSKVIYELQRGKETIFRDVTPRVNPSEGSGPVGFAPAMIGEVRYPILQSLGASFSVFVNKTWGIISAFGLLLKRLFISGKLLEGLSGPVGIAVMTRDFTRLGFSYVLQFVALLTINLGIINAFPFPALDGGRVLFLVIEKIRGAKSLKWQRVANAVGFALLILLMVAVTFKDVSRFSEQFKRLFERIF